jgi:hydroxyacylglutathione hydrolase
MQLDRFEVPGLSHYSYAIGSRGKLAIVDPKRDIDTYLEYAAEREAKIAHILETHIHADYASGARELAEATGAELHLSAYDEGEDYVYQFPHQPMREGDRIVIDGLEISALHTPGHTPEHLAFLLHEAGRGRHPLAMLSGDFLFVGSLGRPDLLGEASKRRLAELLYESLHQKIRDLPDGVEIYPAHGAGSFCGSGMSDRPQSTLGYERASNIFFGDPDKETFVRHILSSVPPFPDYYRRMKRINSEGPQLLGGLPGGQAFEPEDFRDLMEREQAIVIDLRRPETFGGAHIPGSLSIGMGPTFVTWAAWLVPYDRPILLLAEPGADPESARRALVRVGLDDVRGCLKGGMPAWMEKGWEMAELEQISVAELEARRRLGTTIVDVRSDQEWAVGHIPGALHIMGGDLPKRFEELPREGALHLICATGYRSNIAASLLRRNGFSEVANVTGGMTGWLQRGLPVETGA